MWPMFSLLWALASVGEERCEYCALCPELPCVLHRPVDRSEDE